MPFDTILRPDNRLLGWSTGDFSLYGAQPTAAAVTTRVIDPADVRQPDGSRGLGEAAHSGPATDAPHPVPADGAGHTAPEDGPKSSASATPAPLSSSPAADHADAVAAPVVAPQGGSTAFDLIAQPAVIDHIAPDGSLPANAVDQGQAGPVADLAAAAGSLAGDLTGLSAVAAQLAHTQALVQGVTDTAGNALQTVANVASGPVDGALAAVTDAHSDLTDLLAGVAGLDGVQGSIGQAPTLDIDQIIFSGSDPAGGITTLVGMVQSSELFSVGNGEAAPAVPDASGSMVDDLIGDAAAATPLLGNGAHPDPIDHPDLHLGL